MGVIADMIRAGVDPELVERAALELAAQGKPSKERRAIAYTREFEAFWKAYPTDQNMSKYEAFEVWKKIGPDEQRLAMQAIEPFKKWLKAQPKDYRTIHACRFLSKKRYEGHAAGELKLVASNPGVFIRRDDPRWQAFADRYKADVGRYPPETNSGGWFFAEKYAEAS